MDKKRHSQSEDWTILVESVAARGEAEAATLRARQLVAGWIERDRMNGLPTAAPEER